MSLTLRKKCDELMNRIRRLSEGNFKLSSPDIDTYNEVARLVFRQEGRLLFFAVTVEDYWVDLYLESSSIKDIPNPTDEEIIDLFKRLTCSL